MKVYRVTLMVIDHDGIGQEGIRSNIEDTNYGNHWIAPVVMGCDCVDIGEWEDNNPLNYRTTRADAFRELFDPMVYPAHQQANRSETT